MYDTQKIAERIKQRTKACGFSMKTMLSDLELGINIVSHLAKGQVISSVNLARIADYLDCSVDYLLGRTDYPEINNGQFAGDTTGAGKVFKTTDGYAYLKKGSAITPELAERISELMQQYKESE